MCGPPCTRNTVAYGEFPAGVATSACTVPPGPSTNASTTGTDGGATGSGAASTTPPPTARTTGGAAADDQEYSTAPSGRDVASVTVPTGVSSSVAVPSSSTRCSLPRLLWAMGGDVVVASYTRSDSETTRLGSGR